MANRVYKRIQKTCVICNSDFVAIKENQLYCCKTCQQKAMKIKQKEYREREMEAVRIHRDIKKNDAEQLTRDAVEARKLGITYGTYMGYNSTGYLKKFKKMQKNEPLRKQVVNVYGGCI